MLQDIGVWNLCGATKCLLFASLDVIRKGNEITGIPGGVGFEIITQSGAVSDDGLDVGSPTARCFGWHEIQLQIDLLKEVGEHLCGDLNERIFSGV